MKIKYKPWWAEAAQIHRQTELIVFLLLQSAFPKRNRSGAETAYKPSWSGAPFSSIRNICHTHWLGFPSAPSTRQQCHEPAHSLLVQHSWQVVLGSLTGTLHHYSF